MRGKPGLAEQPPLQQGASRSCRGLRRPRPLPRFLGNCVGRVRTWLCGRLIAGTRVESEPGTWPLPRRRPWEAPGSAADSDLSIILFGISVLSGIVEGVHSMPDSDQLPEAQATATRQRRFMNLPILACMAALIILDVAARSRFSVTPLFVLLWSGRHGGRGSSTRLSRACSCALCTLPASGRSAARQRRNVGGGRAHSRRHICGAGVHHLEGGLALSRDAQAHRGTRAKAARLPGLRTHPRERWQLAAPGRDPSAQGNAAGAVSRMRAQAVREPFVIGRIGLSTPMSRALGCP